jgi:putative transposase
VSRRVSPAQRLHAQIDEVFAGGQDLARAIEQVAQLGAQLLLQAPAAASDYGICGRKTSIIVGGRSGYPQGVFRHGDTTPLVSNHGKDSV